MSDNVSFVYPDAQRSHDKSIAAEDNESDGESINVSYVPKLNDDSSGWGGRCGHAEYKSLVLQQVIEQHGHKDGSREIISQLKEFGITVYMAEPDHVDRFLLSRVVRHVQASSLDGSKSPYYHQRCLLYRDECGRLYNLTLNNGCEGLAGTWKGLCIEYSGFQAMVALTVLTRAYACADVAGAIIKSGYISVILGLLLREEMSHVSLNLSMYIMGIPSVAAHTVVSSFDSDWPRKVVILLLALATVMEEGSAYQKYCALAGIGLVMVLLLANLGSKAWHHMKLKPLRCGPFLALFVAVVMGILFPFIGFTKIQGGGKSAIELITFNCIGVSLLFVASGLDIIQQLVIDASQSCNQEGVTISMGIWIAMSAIMCIFAAHKITPPTPHPEDANSILVEEQTSPVGYKVPNFPNFHIDPIMFGNKGFPCFSLHLEMLAGLFVAIGVGGFVVSTTLFDFMNDANEYLNEI
ncbi:hypothetical protein ACHAW5_008779 [Stephanodiscus triporus]|uniref:Threonine/serine exporter-like N-terminal domain-containing protein n=1 Tax=Stephanodiscus triporus TaxID=2934178 RepID=A0ABD3MZP8_9STRA